MDEQGSNPDLAVARHNADGSPDATFDGDGKVTVDFAGAWDGAESVAIQPDGKIMRAGSQGTAREPAMRLVRVAP